MFDLGESVEDYANARAMEALGKLMDYLEKQRKLFVSTSEKKVGREAAEKDMLIASVYNAVQVKVASIMNGYED